MPIATGLAIGLAAASAAGAIGSAAIGSSAAGNAASAQSSASEYAANLQKQESDQALAFQQQVWQQQQANEAPWIQAGQGAVGTLSGLAASQQPWTQQFVAPTDVTEQNDPGFQFRLQQGQQALERSAAAKGGLLTGGAMKDINSYAQDYASNEYNNVYNRALGQYQQAYNIYNQNQANQFNRYATLAGLGQTSAGQLNSAGSQAASNTGNILMNTGMQVGNSLQNAAAAQASGYVGAANAYGGAINNIGNLGMTGALYYGLNNPAGWSPSSQYSQYSDYYPQG